jgi:hypothetical protein
LVNPILMAIVPVIVLLIPGLRTIPFFFRLRMKLRILRWYRALLALEKDVLGANAHANREDLLTRLDHIEQGVNQMKVPASFADQFYALRGYIAFVRNQLVDRSRSLRCRACSIRPSSSTAFRRLTP